MTAAPHPPSSSAYRRVAERLRSGDIELLTSDVFDTLVWRPVASPTHLWRTLGHRLLELGHLEPSIDPADFAEARVRAEARARERHRVPGRSPECHLDEIWDEMPRSWLLAPPAAAIATELDVEIGALRLHRPAIELLELARSLGLALALVSDSYLRAEQLRSLLAATGISDDLLSDVVTSADAGCSKNDGLLAEVWRERKVSPRHALHMGDHPVSDVAAAERAGGNAVLLSLGEGDVAVAGAERVARRWSAGTGTDGGRSAVVRQTLLAAGDDAVDPAYQFGAAVAGPFMAGFAAWVADTTVELGSPAVHCLLREGATIADAVEAMRPGGPTAVRLHASRWGVLRAAVVHGTRDELIEALVRRADLRAEHVEQAFGVPLEKVRAVIGEHPLDHQRRLEAIDAIIADGELHDAIVASAAAIRRRLVTYLERRLVLTDDAPIVLCDIGWGGMIQAGLSRVFSSMGLTHPVVGLYGMVGPGGEDRKAQGARMLSYVPIRDFRSVDDAAAIARNPELIERVTTPRLGTLLDFTDAGEPVCQDIDSDHRPPSLEAAQRGVSDAVATAATMLDEPLVHAWGNDHDVRGLLAAAMASTLTAPDPRLAGAVGDWQHDDVAGTGQVALTAGGLADLLAFANPVDLADIPMTDTFWIPGLASTGDGGLAAQLEAIAAGVSAEQLCPPNPLGSCLVAVFPRNGVRAELLWHRTPRVNSAGWSLVRLRGSVSSLRVIRIDPSEVGASIEIGLLRVRVHHAAGVDDWVLDALGDRRLRIDGGRALGPRVVAMRPLGQWLVRPPQVSGIHAVEVDVAYRGLPVGGVPRVAMMPRWRSLPRRTARYGRSAVRRAQRTLRSWR